jgi:hypothetical protein
LRLMKRCITGWLRTGEDLPTRTPSVKMRPSQWEHFAHDLVWYVTQTTRLAQQTRGVHWIPTPPRDTEWAHGSAYLGRGWCYDYRLVLCLLTHLPYQRRPRSAWDLPYI